MAAGHLLLACLLGSVAVCCLAAGEGKQTQLFADWLHQKRPGKAVAGLASYYSAAEVQDVCMREHKVDGCSCYGRRQEKHCCYSGNVDTDMTCCHGKADKFKGLEKMKEEIISTGKCSYTQMYLEKPVDINEYDSTVRKVGTFSGICTMSKDSDVCGDPACDGMSVTIQGDILRADNVAFEGRPVNALRSESCEKLFMGDCDSSSSSGADADAGSKDGASKKAHIASYGYGGRPYEHSNFYEPKGPSYGGSKGKYEPKYEEPKYGKGYDSKGPTYGERHSDDHYGSKHGDDDKYGKRGDDKYYGGDSKHDDKYAKHGDDKYDEKYYEEPKHEDKYYEEKYDDDKHDYYDDKKIKYYKGSGEVFMGTFYTVNRIHDSKSYSGVYQSVIVVDVDTDKPLEHAPEGSYVARPNEVYFRFVKGGSAELYKA